MTEEESNEHNAAIERDGRAAAHAIVQRARGVGFDFNPQHSESSPTDDAVAGFADEVIRQKLIDAEVPGAAVEFDPDEADRAGAFVEDALSEADARDAEEGLDGPPADRAKLSLFAAARNA